jgi:hypothetical protein
VTPARLGYSWCSSTPRLDAVFQAYFSKAQLLLPPLLGYARCDEILDGSSGLQSMLDKGKMAKWSCGHISTNLLPLPSQGRHFPFLYSMDYNLGEHGRRGRNIR